MRTQTLEKTIDSLSFCIEICIQDCRKCICHRDLQKNALQYLQSYKDDKEDLTALRAYWAEQQENNPLTWSELKQMEGKPVWIETDNVKFWTVVDNFRTICNQECLCCSKGYMCRSTHARGDWQAYRKERENVQS